MKTNPTALLAYLVFLFLMSGNSQAASFFTEFGLSSEYFHYEEQNTQGHRLNREEGLLNGGSFSFGFQPTGNTEFKLTHERVYGEVEYEGFTQSGSGLSTKTKEKFDLFSIRYKRRLGNINGLKYLNWHVSTALNHRNWERKIQPSSAALGLNENYSWNELDFSIEGDYKISASGMLTSKIGMFFGFNEKIDVDLSEVGAGKPSFHFGKVNGQNFNLGYKYLLNTSSEISLLVSYQYWHFDRSGVHSINIGPRRINLTEPESDMHRAGVHVQFRSIF